MINFDGLYQDAGSKKSRCRMSLTKRRGVSSTPDPKKPRKGTLDYEQVDKMDSLTFLYIISAIILAFYVNTTFQDADPVLASKALAQSSLCMMFLARFTLTQARMANPISFDDHLDNKESLVAVIFVIGGYFVINLTVGLVIGISGALELSSYTISPDSTSEDLLTAGFYIVSAIAEEIFFRLVLYAFFKRVVENFGVGVVNTILASVITSGVFMIYHIGVYGGEIDKLLGVFTASMLFCVIYEYSSGDFSGTGKDGGRISVVITIHVINNLVAGKALDLIGTTGLVVLVAAVVAAVPVNLVIDRFRKSRGKAPSYTFRKAGLLFPAYVAIVTVVLVFVYLPMLVVLIDDFASNLTFIIGVIGFGASIFGVLYVQRLQSDMYAEAPSIFGGRG